jgi:hypothetical protein
MPPTLKQRDEILEKEGWIVCCESPFEIEHKETNATASGYAAQIIADQLLENKKGKYDTTFTK